MGDFVSVHTSVHSVLASVDRTLEIAEIGWRDYLAGGERRYAGLTNAITSTRATTNVIQNLKSHVDGFDEWWNEERQILDNPIARWFVQVRNRIEKQGSLGETNVTVVSFNTAELMAQAPTGTVSAFLGDEQGRNGWVVRLADGTEQTIYFSLPKEVADHYYEIDGAPDGQRVDDLFPKWFEQVQILAARARIRFGSVDKA